MSTLLAGTVMVLSITEPVEVAGPVAIWGEFVENDACKSEATASGIEKAFSEL